MVIGRHTLGVHETCVHETFGTIRSIFTTNCFKSYSPNRQTDTHTHELILFVYCQYPCYYCNCCSFMYCHINKLKKWLFYIYLLTTITKALYQSSEKGMSLLFTCLQLTEESSLTAAARMWLLTTACIM